MAGVVSVDGQRVDKAGTAVKETAKLDVAEREPFVSRAGRKLAGALETFGIDPADKVCLDVGASTGGFTDCLLKRGARRVYALDVGYGQLDAGLRNDSRVVVMDRINARHLGTDALPEPCELITVDVSFISLAKVVPALLAHLGPDGELLTLIKPQFEAGRGVVGKGGILRDESVRRRVIVGAVEQLETLGLEGLGLVDCDVKGAGGNQEAVARFRRQASTIEGGNPAARSAGAGEAHAGNRTGSGGGSMSRGD